MANVQPRNTSYCGEELILDRTGLTSRQLQSLRRRKLIPYTRIGHRTIVYSLVDVLKALEKVTVHAHE